MYNMYTKKILLIISILIFSQITANAQEDINTGMIYGEGYAYVLTAPKGWVLDNQSGISQGFHAVFYPAGSSWENGAVVCYTNAVPLEINETIDDVIKSDIDKFKKNSPDLKVEQKGLIFIDLDKKAKVAYFAGDVNNNYEAIAYIPEEKAIILVGLSAKTKEGFSSSLTAFQALVKSYSFLTDKVTEQ